MLRGKWISVLFAHKPEHLNHCCALPRPTDVMGNFLFWCLILVVARLGCFVIDLTLGWILVAWFAIDENLIHHVKKTFLPCTLSSQGFGSQPTTIFRQEQIP